jgi:hypothetical protein
MPRRKKEVVIHDGNYKKHLRPTVGGERKSTGLIPRDWSAFPAGCYASAPHTAIDMPVIPKSEWSARIKELEDTKSRISDMRLVGNGGQPIPALDQDGVGYCWAHSSTGAVMMLRCLMNAPYVPLSAFCVAATIKQGADEGGWGAQSLDFITQKGVCSQALWPQGDRSYRKYDKPEVWANAALHKVTEGWVDMAAAQYDRNLTFEQVVTCLLSRIPVVVDMNWWSHSILAIDAVEIESGSYGIRILNSWGDSWSEKGTGVLQGSKAHPDGAVAPRVTTASAA